MIIFQLVRKKYKTVFVEQWPEYNEKYLEPKLEEKWEVILSLREDVLKALEEKRKEKLIGNSLDAKVILDIHDQDLKKFLTDFDESFFGRYFYCISM